MFLYLSVAVAVSDAVFVCVVTNCIENNIWAYLQNNAIFKFVPHDVENNVSEALGL